MSLVNFNKYDPFADTGGDNNEPTSNIHIRIQQRNGRKTLTTVQGLPSQYDPQKILKVAKKKFSTNGNIVNDPISGEVIQMQGDQRLNIKDLLVEDLSIDEKTIKVHGF